MATSKSLKIPAFFKKLDLLLFFSSLLIGLKGREFSNFWKSPFLVRIGSLYLGLKLMRLHLLHLLSIVFAVLQKVTEVVHVL